MKIPNFKGMLSHCRNYLSFCGLSPVETFGFTVVINIEVSSKGFPGHLSTYHTQSGHEFPEIPGTLPVVALLILLKIPVEITQRN